MINIFAYIIGLGASVMMPIIFSILGISIGVRPARAIKCGLTVGVGFVGLSVVTGLLTGALGPALGQIVTTYGLSLQVFDMGWPAAAAMAYNTLVGSLVIPVCLGVNVLMLVTRCTRTINIDLWNYWHFAFVGAVTYFVMDESLAWGFFAATVCCIVTLVMADLTTEKFQEYYEGMETISIPQPFCQSVVPIALVMNALMDRIPGFGRLDIDAEGLKRRFGVIGEPLVLGVVVGIGIGLLARQDAKGVLVLGITMGAVMELIPRITRLFIEGLTPISDRTRELVGRRFGDRSFSIGMSPALVIGHPTTLVVSLLLIPVTLVLAVVLPGNRFLPLASLAGMFYLFPMILPITRGNVVKTFVIGLLVLTIGLYFVTDMAPDFTMAAAAVYAKTGDATARIPEGFDGGALDFASSLFGWTIYKLTCYGRYAGAALLSILTLGLMLYNRRQIVKK